MRALRVDEWRGATIDGLESIFLHEAGRTHRPSYE